MANKNLFKNGAVKNEAGGFAYKLEPRAALAQYSVTGCLGQTFYCKAESQLDDILSLCDKVDADFVAKTAVYSREKGHMKDVPALLCVWLAARKKTDLIYKVFPRVIDNGKMLRNFVQILRSGVVGRKSVGSVIKRLIANWFNSRTDKEIFSQSIGQDPSFKDILRIAHPRPLGDTKNALYRWMLGRECDQDSLPVNVRKYELFRNGETKEIPDVPFEMLTSLKLGQSEWCQILMNANWQWTRMNLDLLQRKQVFDIPEMVDLAARKLVDRSAISKARVFPYQILIAYVMAYNAPHKIREALQDALEIATENVPSLPGDGYVAVDVSTSMRSPVTGYREGATSKVRCVDVAGLIASSILRKNPSSTLIPFAEKVKNHSLNSRDTVLTNADKLAKMLGGGTNCSSPLSMLNQKGAIGDWFYLISDNQSWVDSLPGITNPFIGSRYNNSGPGHTGFMKEWDLFKSRNPNARMICLDVQPYKTTQAQERSDILNVGGFSDSVFNIANLFFKGEMSAEHWVGLIEEVKL